jgi:hypothetical protein
MPTEKVARKRVKPPNWTGLKARPEGLDEWVRLANLIPRGSTLPEIAPVTSRIESSGVALTWAATLERLHDLPPTVADDFWEPRK